MPTVSPKSTIARFGSFELDTRTGELRKSGIRMRLPEQSFQVLALLLERQGQLVTREELRQRLWQDDTFVDFELGLNRAVNKLRKALCDAAGVPRFIETVPRHGYRFLAPVSFAKHSGANGGDRNSPRSLAIIPFTNTSGNPDADYLCAGLAESLIYRFAELPSLRVMACTTAFRYRNSTLDALSIGGELEVDAVLTGRAVMRGDSLSIGAELVDVRDGSLLWGHHYNRKLADLFEVQENMSRAIFDSLRLTLTQHQINRVQKRQTSNLEAHQLYLRGVFNWNKREPESVRRAMEYFQRAQDVDPGYALAHSGLADCFAVLSIYPYCFLPPKQGMARAKAAAQCALELDPELAEAHTTMGLVNLLHDWNFAESERRFRRAQELKPSYPIAHLWHCMYCIAMGRLDEALAEAQKARELDPLSTIACLMPPIVLSLKRQYDRALEEIRLPLTLEPTYAFVHLFTGYTQCGRGRPDLGIEAFTKAVDCSPKGDVNPAALSRLGFAYARAGETERALATLEKLDELSRRRYVPPDGRAFINIGLQRGEAALDAIEEMVCERSDYVIYLNTHFAFDAVREHPRFKAAMEQVYGRSRKASAE